MIETISPQIGTTTFTLVMLSMFVNASLFSNLGTMFRYGKLPPSLYIHSYYTFEYLFFFPTKQFEAFIKKRVLSRKPTK